MQRSEPSISPATFPQATPSQRYRIHGNSAPASTRSCPELPTCYGTPHRHPGSTRTPARTAPRSLHKSLPPPSDRSAAPASTLSRTAFRLPQSASSSYGHPRHPDHLVFSGISKQQAQQPLARIVCRFNHAPDGSSWFRLPQPQQRGHIAGVRTGKRARSGGLALTSD